MPELPEVETMVRGIRPHVEGREILILRECRCTCRPISMSPAMTQMAKRSRGRTIAAVRRIAKRVVLELSSREAFVIEPRMTGLMLLADPPNQTHLRLEWKFADRREFDSLWFWDQRGLGTVQLMTPDELARKLGPLHLGPDALAITVEEWRERCRCTSRPIKVALLDQKFVAGIGNLYASEILHLAGIHPARRTDELKPAQIRKLHAATQEILHEAIRYEGSTLNDGTYRNALNQNGSYQNAHRVYNRWRQKCPTCRRGEILRFVQAQRSTFFCPVCQRQPRGVGRTARVEVKD